MPFVMVCTYKQGMGRKRARFMIKEECFIGGSEETSENLYNI